MRLDEAGGGPVPSDARCGGFQVLFEDDTALVRLLPGERRLPDGMASAVLQGLSEAPQLLADALRLAPPPRAYERVEVKLQSGELTQGEALAVGAGSIRIFLGEGARAEEATRIARHEALHLLLSASLRGGERWNDPELAFADWIVRGIESGREAQVPRFHAPLPQLVARPPSSRAEVQKQLASPPGAARRYFGDALWLELSRVEGEQRKLWLVEAALGAHYLEAACRLDDLGAVVLDDWLLDYEQYARAVGNPPSGAGHLWQLSDPGWSRDPLVRLSVAAQALQCDDHCFFSGERTEVEPVVWKNRGRVRLPLRSAARARAHPVHGFRAAVRDAPELALVEQAARGEAAGFEARALWPRILARLLAADLPAPALDPQPPLPVVQIVDSEGAEEALAAWTKAAAWLRAVLGERGGWVPRIAEPRHAATLAEAPRPPAAVLLVHAGPLTESTLLASRRLAANKPIRGALFIGLARGVPWERLPDLPEPLDPRYREELWEMGPGLPETLSGLPQAMDEATREGRLSTPLSHLLSMMAIGLEECHYPRPIQR